MSTPNLQLPRSGHQVGAAALELMGKTAAQFAESNQISLTDAVIETLQAHPDLTPEHIRRVVEFANTEAFNQKYASLDPSHRVVDIEGGPADPQSVLQACASANAAAPVVLPSLEYAAAPLPGTKTSSTMFEASERTRGGILQDVDGLRTKLSSAHEEAVQSREVSRSYMNDAMVKLAQSTLAAAGQGASGSEVFAVWAAFEPELAKVAYQKVAHYFKGEQTKVAGRSIRPTAQVSVDFQDFVKKAASFLAYTEAVQNVEAELVRVKDWLKDQGVRA